MKYRISYKLLFWKLAIFHGKSFEIDSKAIQLNYQVITWIGFVESQLIMFTRAEWYSRGALNFSGLISNRVLGKRNNL